MELNLLPRLLLKHPISVVTQLSLRAVSRHLSSAGCSARESPGSDGQCAAGHCGDTAEAGLQRSLRVAVVGLPNAGKSTLINRLLSRKVFAVSPKVHTTVRRALGVFTEGNSQICDHSATPSQLLLDTPGVVLYQYGRRLRLPRTFLTDPVRSLSEAEMVVVISDVSDVQSRAELHPAILQALRSSPDTPAVLVMNKVDVVKRKQVLLEMAEALTGTMERRGKEKRLHYLQRCLRRHQQQQQQQQQVTTVSQDRERIEKEISELQVGLERITGNGTVPNPETPVWRPHFKEIFMISALTGDGVISLKDFLISSARPRPWEYGAEEVTDQPPLTLVEDIVREKLFLHLDKEIPYVITQENVQWEKGEDGSLVIYQNLTCKHHSQASIVIGPRGTTIQAVTSQAKEDIEALLNCSVELTLNVRSR